MMKCHIMRKIQDLELRTGVLILRWLPAPVGHLRPASFFYTLWFYATQSTGRLWCLHKLSQQREEQQQQQKLSCPFSFPVKSGIAQLSFIKGTASLAGRRCLRGAQNQEVAEGSAKACSDPQALPSASLSEQLSHPATAFLG